MEESLLLFDMFPVCRDNERLTADYSGARVTKVSIEKERTVMRLILSLKEPVPPLEVTAIEEILAQEFGLDTVSIEAFYVRASNGLATNKQVKPPSKKKTTATPGSMIMGKRVGETLTPMEDLTLELGKVNVRGVVCDVSSRFIEKSNAWVLGFDLTDHTGTIHVSKFMNDENDSKVVKKVQKDMWLTVTGKMSMSRYLGDLTLEPTAISVSTHESTNDTAEEKRVELHLHTKMSAMDAVTDTAEAIQRAAQWGHPAIAITDHGVVHSFPEAAQAADALRGKVKVIYGVEGYYRNDVDVRDEDKQNSGSKKERVRFRHIILLARNSTGLSNLYKLITKSHLENFSRYPIILKSMLLEYREGLIIGSACEAGEIFDAVSQGRDDDEIRRLATFYDYLEIQPVCNNMFMLFGDKPRAKSEDDIRGYNRRIVDIGKELCIPVVATGDVHFLDPEHEVFRHILLSSKGFNSADDDLPIYFKTTDEMLEEFGYLGEEDAYEVVVRNSRRIADMCDTVNPLPPRKKLFPPMLERSAEELKERVENRQRELYGDNPPEVVSERITAELDDILERGYDVIYMSAQKLVADSIRQGYLVGSRGSVGSSFVAFLAGITEVNALPAHYRCPKCRRSDFEAMSNYGCGADMPDMSCPDCGTMYIKDGFNIPFETFLGFGGDKVPDIDLNFSGEYQTQAHKHTMALFGNEYVFRAGTIGKIAEKTAIGHVRKYLESLGKTVTKAEENRLMRGCVGVKRTTGQHPGGLVVIPQGMEITDFCPAQHPADDSDKGIITTHFEYKCLEDNLIKLDVLGHDDPTMIKMLEDLTGVNAMEIKLDDPVTMSIFTSPVPLGLPENDDIIGSTGTIGIPEFGTSLTRQMLFDTKPKDFDTLVRLSGFSHGEGVWIGNSRDLILSGKATVSETIGCRDDIMLFLITKGMNDRQAFKISESIRKGYGLPEGTEEEMVNLRIPDWYIESCKRITYLFPKAHAVAYVMMAFRIAWFKAHRPLEFYSAYFYRRSQKDSFDEELMTRGIDIVRRKIREIKNSPDSKQKDMELLITLEACYEFYMRGYEFSGIDLYLSDPVKFLVEGDKKLRPPFVAISGLGETAAYDLVECRAKHQFVSIDDISVVCTKVSKAHLAQLKTTGALGDLPESSQMSLF